MTKPNRKQIREKSQPSEKILETRLKTSRQVVLGVDPGLAKTGITFLERVGRAKPRVLEVIVLETSPAKKKGSNTLRVTIDDQRRYKEIYTGMSALCQKYNPFAVGVEAYLIGQQAASSAWKTAVVYGGILYYAYSQNMFVAPFLPLDLKRRFAGKKGASKLDVADGLYPLVTGLEDMISVLPKTKREHAVDAAGHAFLVFEEIDKTRELLGI